MKTPIVLVNGNPETPAVWDLVVARLLEQGFDAPIRLAPPGFGNGVPSGFEPSPIAYRDWLVQQLERIGEPVDLVGHDWGGVHVVLTAMHRPDLLRSWVSDEVSMLQPEYEWHELGRMWQRPGDGEQWVEQQHAMSLGQRAAQLTDLGMDARVATAIAAGFDPAMGETILALYRAAEQPVLAELGRDLESAGARPGLAVIATEDDTPGSVELRRAAAARAGAQHTELVGSRHWWMTEGDGGAGADALMRFWRALS